VKLLRSAFSSQIAGTKLYISACKYLNSLDSTTVN